MRQQQVAMRLHRADKGSSKPLWWIVTTLVLQARCAGGALDPACLHANSKPVRRIHR